MKKHLKLFFDNFATLAQSPDGIKQLREMILQFAVMGKLVAQDPDDEPVMVLVEKIEAEKRKLIKQGKIKKQKPLLPIELDEIPYKLPKEWEWARLSYFSEVFRGVSYKKDMASNVPLKKHAPLLRANNIGQILNYDNLVYVPDSCIKPEQYVRKYDIVVAMSSGSKNLVGKTAQNIKDFQGSFGAFCGLIRPLSLLNPQYVALYLQSPIYRSVISSFGKGIGINNLRKTDLEKMLFSIPPLNEQKRIVSRVNELMGLCDRLEEKLEKKNTCQVSLNNSALDHLVKADSKNDFDRHWKLVCNNFYSLYDCTENVDQLRKAILQLAVMGKLVSQDPQDEPASVLLQKIETEKQRLIKKKIIKTKNTLHRKAQSAPSYKIPNSWEWVRFRDVIWCFRGHNPPKSDFIYKPRNGYVRFIQITDFKTDDKAVYVPKSNRLKMVYKDEIIMAAYRHIGKLSRNMEGAFNVALCKINEIAPMDRDFIEFLIRTDLVKGELLRASERGHIPSMHSDHLLSLFVPIPPEKEQKRIISRVAELMGLCDRLEESIQKGRTKSEKLTSSAIHHLLGVA